jgi:hypothetical protein
VEVDRPRQLPPESDHLVLQLGYSGGRQFGRTSGLPAFGAQGRVRALDQEVFVILPFCLLLPVRLLEPRILLQAPLERAWSAHPGYGAAGWLTISASQTFMDAERLIDRNRRLLAIAADIRALTGRVVARSSESHAMLHATTMRSVELHRVRLGLLADTIYLRHAIADKMRRAARSRPRITEAGCPPAGIADRRCAPARGLLARSAVARPAIAVRLAPRCPLHCA